MTWDYRQNLRSVTNHLNLENGRFFISNFMWLNFQNLVARYSRGDFVLLFKCALCYFGWQRETRISPLFRREWLAGREENGRSFVAADG